MARQTKKDNRHHYTRIAAAGVFLLLIGCGVLMGSQGWLDERRFMLVFCSAGLAFVVVLWPFPYWCPQCRKRLRMSHEMRPRHIYPCTQCEVDWDVGISDSTD